MKKAFLLTLLTLTAFAFAMDKTSHSLKDYLANNPQIIKQRRFGRTLNLTKLNLKDLDGFLDIENFKDLDSLDLSNNKLKEIPTFIMDLTNLKTLDLSNNQLTEVPAFLFKKMPYLGSLNLSNNQLSAENIDEIKKARPYIYIIH